MKVQVLPSDQGGCGHYRLIYPAEQVRKEGIEIEFAEALPIIRTKEHSPRVIRVGNVDADVIVIQRPLHRVVADAIPLFKKKGIGVIVDMDDDFQCLHPNHLARRIYDPKTSSEYNWDHLKRAVKEADLVTCSTPALAQRYGGAGHAMVLPNCVPESMLDITADRDGRTVGWSGYTSFHPKDLTATRGGVARAIEETDARFCVLGSKEGVQEELDLKDEPAEWAPVPLKEYPFHIARFDVGIVPLLESKFNDAKSYLKGLEFAAVGVPFVASLTPEYNTLNRGGIGLLAAERSRSWRSQVKRLLESSAYRIELAEAGRDVVNMYHTYEGNGWRWAEAWSMVVESNRIRRVLAS